LTQKRAPSGKPEFIHQPRRTATLPIWPPPAARYRARHGFEREPDAPRGPRRIPSRFPSAARKLWAHAFRREGGTTRSTSAWRPFLSVRASASLSLAIISTKSGLWYRLFADRPAQIRCPELHIAHIIAEARLIAPFDAPKHEPSSFGFPRNIPGC